MPKGAQSLREAEQGFKPRQPGSKATVPTTGHLAKQRITVPLLERSRAHRVARHLGVKTWAGLTEEGEQTFLWAGTYLFSIMGQSAWGKSDRAGEDFRSPESRVQREGRTLHSDRPQPHFSTHSRGGNFW